MKNIRRFTLVELLAVIALIAVLSAIGFGTYSYAKGKAQETATEALMKQIEAGLEGFHTKAGYYPKSNNDDFSVIKFTFAADGTLDKIEFGGETLEKQSISDGDSQAKKKRMKNERLEAFSKAVEMEVIKSNLDNDGVLTDAWGGKIYYRSPGKFKTGSYDLVSAGPDEKFGKDSAADPTGITDLGKFRENAGEHVCDDLFNF